jgi:hypothetical protein
MHQFLFDKPFLGIRNRLRKPKKGRFLSSFLLICPFFHNFGFYSRKSAIIELKLQKTCFYNFVITKILKISLRNFCVFK